MQIKPKTKDAYQLLHNGTLAIADMEMNGIRVDVPALDALEAEFLDLQEQHRKTLDQSDLGKMWRGTYGLGLSYGSEDQLRHLLYTKMGFKVDKKTKGGKASTDGEQLARFYDVAPELATLADYAEVVKTLGTNIKGYRKYIVGDRIHPSFMLHTVRTFRSSSKNPNFQNIPKHGLGKRIREIFIPSDGHVLYECDYTGMEVAFATCYHKDPEMKRFLLEGYDMHRRVSAICFVLDEAKVTSQIRGECKGAFVFAGFYGAGVTSIARNLWANVATIAKLDDGTPLTTHLEKQGIKGWEGFKAHIEKCFDTFWNEWYKDYGKWREDVWDEYNRTLEVQYLTGFTASGLMQYTQVINCQVQGSAFHALLHAAAKINNHLKRRNMKTMLIGQIHDALVADVHKAEEEEYKALIQRYMVDELYKKWDWVCVPIRATMERSETNWKTMEEL